MGTFPIESFYAFVSGKGNILSCENVYIIQTLNRKELWNL